MLFLNIEAAQAGLVHKIKLYIRHECPDYQLLYIALALLVLGFLSYVLFAPVLIGKEKWAWLNYYSYQPNRHDYQSKRATIQKISGILSNAEFSKEAHS
jgi:hypothetical protein